MSQLQRIKHFFSHPVWFHLLIGLCMSGAVWLCYKDSLSAVFQLDDGMLIAQNPDAHMKEFDLKEWFHNAFYGRAGSRWFAMMTISLNYYFAWLKPYYYRLFNVIIHMGSCFLLYLLLVSTFRRLKTDADDLYLRMVAFLAAMAWGLHPLQTTAVTYIIQRMASLSGMLYFASLGCYIAGRVRGGWKRWAWYTGCAATAVLSVSSKQTGAMIPAAILLYEFYFFRDLRFSKDDARNRKIVRTLLVCAAVALVAVLWQGNALVGLVPHNYERYDFDLYQRLISQPRILVYYLSLIFWPRPHRICTDPSFVNHSDTLLDPWTTLPSFLVLAFLLYAVYALRKRQKLVSFGICWMLLNLLLEQTIIPLQLVFHHRLYVPSAFLIGGLVFWVMEGARRTRFKTAVLMATSAVIALFGFSSYLRNIVWNNPEKIWEAELNLDPDSTRILINLSKDYLNKGQARKALPILFRALEVNRDMPAAYINLAMAFTQLRMYKKAVFYLEEGVRNIKLWPEKDAASVQLSLAFNYTALKENEKAEKYYKKALDYATDNRYMIYFKLAALYYATDRKEEAINYAEMAVAEEDRFYEGYFYLGSLYAIETKEFQKAEEAFKKSLGGEPDINVKAYKHLASLAQRKDDLDEAVEWYEKARAIRPKDGDILLTLGTIFATKGEKEKAKELYRQCLQAGDLGSLNKAYFNLGKIAVTERNAPEALRYLESSYNLDSRHVPTLFMLGNLYIELTKYEKGKEVLEILLALEPDYENKEFVKQRIAFAESHLDEKKGEEKKKSQDPDQKKEQAPDKEQKQQPDQ